MVTIERKVQLQYIDARLAEESQLPSFDMGGDHLPDICFLQAALASHARDLKFGGRGGDVRIEARCRGCDEVDRNGGAGIVLPGRRNIR